MEYKTTEELAKIHQEKTEKWNNRDGMDMFRNKSPYEDIPIWVGHGSSSHHPQRKGGITTSDIVVWCRFADSQWFRPYGGFNGQQIQQLIEICDNDSQVERMVEMLSCKPE